MRRDRKSWLCGWTLGLAAALVLSAEAAAQSMSAGARVAGAYSYLPQPVDPRGQPSLMSGTAFSGLGAGGGVWWSMVAAKSESLRLAVDVSLLYSRLRAEGYEQIGEARREALLTTDVLRLPALLVVSRRGDEGRGRVGVGLELLAGLASEASVTMENTEEDALPLYTKPVTHVGLSGLLGWDLVLGDGWRVPLEMRVTFDPSVGSTTVGRFDGFKTSEEPGDYEAAFRWQILMTTGVSFEL